MDDLLAQDIYAYGTIRSNRKDLPPCAKNKLKQGEKVSAQHGSSVLQNGMIKKKISFLSRNVCPVKPHVLFSAERMGEISTH